MASSLLSHSSLEGPPREQRVAYLLLRLLTGLDFFGHGFARVFTGTRLSGFAHGMVKSMADTPLPGWLTLGTGYVVPLVELAVGFLLLTGLWVGGALRTAFLLMLVLMFGVTLKQDWNAAAQQMVYGLVLAVLLFGRERFHSSWLSVLRA